MRLPKAVTWLSFGGLASIAAVLPVNIFGMTAGSTLAQVECFDCYTCPPICCGDCGSSTQEGKCTLGTPWCNGTTCKSGE